MERREADRVFRRLRVFEIAETEWLSRSLWAGATRVLGATATALVGSPDEIAAEILRFKAAGISQFIFHGWPKLDEMRRFGREVIPRIRKLESRRPRAAAMRSLHDT